MRQTIVTLLDLDLSRVASDLLDKTTPEKLLHELFDQALATYRNRSRWKEVCPRLGSRRSGEFRLKLFPQGNPILRNMWAPKYRSASRPMPTSRNLRFVSNLPNHPNSLFPFPAISSEELCRSFLLHKSAPSDVPRLITHDPAHPLTGIPRGNKDIATRYELLILRREGCSSVKRNSNGTDMAGVTSTPNYS